MNEFLSAIKKVSESFLFQKEKMYLTYSEYVTFSVEPQRKYRNGYKDKLMRFSLIRLFAYYRARYNYYKRFRINDFIAYRNHLLENLDDYLDLYNSLTDEQSKKVLIEVLCARFTGDFRKALSNSKQYFEKDIIKFEQGEVFVDCGAWVGDSTDIFLNCNKYPSTCYVIEPDIFSLACAKKNLINKNSNFHFIPTGVSDKKEILSFCMSGGSGASFEKTSDSLKKVELQLDKIDNIVQEPATFIKMDLEGFEMKALSGARQQITKYHPKLAICIYHKPDDFITIFKSIKSFDTTSQYKYYIRHYSPMHNETVLYAIPD